MRAWASKIGAQPAASQAARDLADSMGPRAGQQAAQAEVESAEPDDLYVARRRAEFETHMRVSGPGWPSYRYPST